MDRAAIRTEGLGVSFGALRALDDVNLEVPRATVFGFLGPNGAGKSTMIRVLLGLLEATDGSVTVAGFDPRTHGDEARARCGVLLDQPGLYERMSAEENLEFFGRAYRMDAADRRARIRELLEHVALWDRRREAVSTWSLGMRKKLAIVRAVMHRPPVVFLDEPTNGLDPIARAALRDDITALAAIEGTTVFLTTHELDDAQRMCETVGVLQSGRLLATGTPDELEREHLGTRVELRGQGFDSRVVDAMRALPGVVSLSSGDGQVEVVLGPDGRVPQLVRLSVEAGVEIEEVSPARSSLEDAFLAIVASGEDGPADGEGSS